MSLSLLNIIEITTTIIFSIFVVFVYAFSSVCHYGKKKSTGVLQVAKYFIYLRNSYIAER